MNENLANEKMTAVAAKDATANRLAFAEWMLACTPGADKFDGKQRAAFLKAATMAEAGYKLYQAAKPTSKKYEEDGPAVADDRTLATVVVIGPNLARSSESFHVHAAGCSDVARKPMYKNHQEDAKYTYLAGTRLEIVHAIYADQIAEGDSADDLVSDFRWFPCCGL